MLGAVQLADRQESEDRHRETDLHQLEIARDGLRGEPASQHAGRDQERQHQHEAAAGERKPGARRGRRALPAGFGPPRRAQGLLVFLDERARRFQQPRAVESLARHLRHPRVDHRLRGSPPARRSSSLIVTISRPRSRTACSTGIAAWSQTSPAILANVMPECASSTCRRSSGRLALAGFIASTKVAV